MGCQCTYKSYSLKNGIFLYFLCYFSPGWQNKCLQLSGAFRLPLLIKQIWNQLPELILVLFVEFPFCACKSVKSPSHFLCKTPGLWQAAGDITSHDDFSIKKRIFMLRKRPVINMKILIRDKGVFKLLSLFCEPDDFPALIKRLSIVMGKINICKN